MSPSIPHSSAWVSGVCLEFARRMQVPAGLIRLVCVVLLALSAGYIALLYPVASWWLSREAWKQHHADKPYPDLAKLPNQGWLGGICAGVAAFSATPVWLIRLLTVWAAFSLPGFAILVYIGALFFFENGDETRYPEVPVSSVSPWILIGLGLVICVAIPLLFGAGFSLFAGGAWHLFHHPHGFRF